MKTEVFRRPMKAIRVEKVVTRETVLENITTEVGVIQRSRVMVVKV